MSSSAPPSAGATATPSRARRLNRRQTLQDHARHGIELVRTVSQGNQWRSRDSGAFDTDAFSIDWDAVTVVCPHGHRNTWSGTGSDQRGQPRVMFTFSLTDCTNGVSGVFG